MDAPALAALLVGSGLLPHLGIREGDAVVGFHSRKLIAALLVPVSGVALWQGAGAWLLGAWVLFGVGFWIWHRPGDWPHAVWHLSTAATMTLILIGI